MRLHGVTDSSRPMSNGSFANSLFSLADSIWRQGQRLSVASMSLPAENRRSIETLNGISALIDQSLLRRVELVEGEPRVMILDTIREFAREELDRCGELSYARHFHAMYFADQLSRGHATLKGPDQVEWMAWTSRELDNIRSTAVTLLDSRDKEKALTFIAELSSFWEGRIALKEFGVWLDRAFDLPGELSAEAELNGAFACSHGRRRSRVIG